MTAIFQHPFQCIQYLERKPFRGLLIATAGSKIYSYAAESGQRLSVWPQNSEPSNDESTKTVDAKPESEGQGPPEKKRKISSSADDKKEDAKKSAVTWSNIPLLVASPNGDHVVALTAEDKSIRVFNVEDDGTLKQLSVRSMPKRPCAIDFTSDGSTILCGDKFGDVYSLPLIPSETKIAAVKKAAPEKRAFQPSATPLTVHTKRNLKSLEQQLRLKTIAGEKSGPDFEHELILGHVSLLTDLVFVTLPLSNGSRSYILTADRDEHIRVSRGPPQAHVIEKYCLGHTSFISKLCIPQWAPEILVSGGGDNYLLVWKWTEARILQKVLLVDDQASEGPEVTVRGIWAESLSRSGDGSEKANLLFVAIEGSANLLCYTLEPNGTVKPQSSIQLSGNALDVTSVETDGTVLVSVDGIREAGSLQTWKASPASPQILLESFHLKVGQDSLEWEPVSDSITAKINSEGTSEVSAPDAKQQKELNDAIYSVGNLRKRSQGDDE